MPALTGLAFKYILERLGQQSVQLITNNADEDVLLESFTFDRLMLSRRIVATVEFRDCPPAKLVVIDLSFGQRDPCPAQFAADEPFKNGADVGLDLTAA